MPQHVVIIGAVALGPKSACRLKRLDPEAKVTLVDRSATISYGGCGIPYYVSGEVSEFSQLQDTSFHVRRDAAFFRDCKGGIDVLSGFECTGIDRNARQVTLLNISTGSLSTLPYDQLVLATGSRSRRLSLPGVELEGVLHLEGPAQAIQMRESVAKGQVDKVVVIGAGFIGLEMAEAFSDMWGVDTTVVEIADQILPGRVSPVLARMGQRHMEEKGVSFQLATRVLRFEGNGKLERLITDQGELQADLALIAAGVVPNGELARAAGLAVSPGGAIIVDERMRTSDPHIFAGGDCVEVRHLITGKPFHLPMGSLANRQGRVIGSNLAGRQDSFPGAVGSFVVKLFDCSLAGAGLSLREAQQNGLDALAVLLPQLDRAHFYPKKEMMTLELIVERATRRVLGIQGFGSAGDALVGRVNAVAGLLPHGANLAELSNLELAYSPPFSTAMDIVNALANVAENELEGRNKGIGPDDFVRIWGERDSERWFVLDCRETANAQPYLERYPENWHNIPQGQLDKRMDEVPRDRTVVLICNTGGRAYEAQITLARHGIVDVLNVHGGMVALKQWGWESETT